MTQMHAEQALVIISVHPRLDELMVDWLLQSALVDGFSSFSIHGHSGDHSDLTITEQVRGRQRRERFEIAIGTSELDEFLHQLVEKFEGTDAHYWVVPVLTSKDLNSDSI